MKTKTCLLPPSFLVYSPGICMVPAVHHNPLLFKLSKSRTTAHLCFVFFLLFLPPVEPISAIFFQSHYSLQVFKNAFTTISTIPHPFPWWVGQTFRGTKCHKKIWLNKEKVYKNTAQGQKYRDTQWIWSENLALINCNEALQDQSPTHSDPEPEVNVYFVQ